MPPLRVTRKDNPLISLVEFKVKARRLLPHHHPLLRILANAPDSIRASDLDARIGDWLTLLED